VVVRLKVLIAFSNFVCKGIECHEGIVTCHAFATSRLPRRVHCRHSLAVAVEVRI
jgi:hypothetical protein